MSQTVPRQTAEARREAVLEAARHEFAQHGLHGASTDAIARRAGISQPYLFRLFGSKKALFIAVNDMCFQMTISASSASDSAAAANDEEIRASVARGYGRLVDYVEAVSGADKQTVARFFAKGMLMNVLAAMDYSLANEPRDSWAARLAEGCKDEA